MTGIEPSPAACRTARARGVDAREGTLGDVTLESGAYDAAIFRHSLEHTDDVRPGSDGGRQSASTRRSPAGHRSELRVLAATPLR